MAVLKNTTINDTGFLELPSGTSAERPSVPQAGMARFNTDSNVKEMYNGSIWIPLTPFPYVSNLNAATLGFTAGPADVKGESEDEGGFCPQMQSFEQALNTVHARNARLPTVTEVSQDVGRGSGCGFDSELIWTANSVSVDGERHYVVLGDLTNPPAGVIARPYTNNGVFRFRYAADVDTNRSDPVLLNDHFIYNFLYG